MCLQVSISSTLLPWYNCHPSILLGEEGTASTIRPRFQQAAPPPPPAAARASPSDDAAAATTLTRLRSYCPIHFSQCRISLSTYALLVVASSLLLLFEFWDFLFFDDMIAVAVVAVAVVAFAIAGAAERGAGHQSISIVILVVIHRSRRRLSRRLSRQSATESPSRRRLVGDWSATQSPTSRHELFSKNIIPTYVRIVRRTSDRILQIAKIRYC